ncbi:MAG: ROK family protein [bacterium]|jgi:glucokinase
MSAKLAVALDIGGSAVKAGLVDTSSGELVSFVGRVEIGTDNPAEFAAGLPALVRFLLEGAEGDEIAGVGISVAGLCRDGIVAEAPNLKWFDAPLARLASDALSSDGIAAKVAVENDADCFTLGEWKYGVAKDCRSVLGLTLGTGIGGGFVKDGKLFHGGQGYGIEPGHSKIPQDMEWPPCGCGGRFCLEAGAAAKGIIWTYIEKGGKAEPGITVETIKRRAEEGEEAALRTFRRIGMRIGIGIAGMCNMLNPDAVVIGGGISGAREFIEPMLRSHLEAGTLISVRANAELLWSELQNRANLLGAACALGA